MIDYIKHWLRKRRIRRQVRMFIKEPSMDAELRMKIEKKMRNGES